MPYIICVAGEPDPAWWPGICGELSARGLKVGLVRRDLEEAARPQSAAAEVKVGDGSLRVERKDSEAATLESLMARYLGDMDLVLSDMYQGEKRAKLEFVAKGAVPGLAGDPGLKALISPKEVDGELPCFAPDDLAGLADFLVNQVIPEPKPAGVRVILDGRRVPANRFVQDILSGTIRGMVTPLKGGDRPGLLEIYLD